MKKRTAMFLLLIPPFMFSAWLFVGFDHYVGDHEVGSWWEPFIKFKPTFQVKFKKPEQRIMEFEPYETLDLGRKRSFIEYCEIRWGTNNPQECEKIAANHRN